MATNNMAVKKEKKKLKGWVTALIVVGSVAFVFLVGFICCSIW